MIDQLYTIMVAAFEFIFLDWEEKYGEWKVYAMYGIFREFAAINQHKELYAWSKQLSEDMR